MPQVPFVPVDPNLLVGPYPQPQVQQQRPYIPGGSKKANVAKIFTSFLEGAQRGRIQKFTMEQNEKLKNIAILGQYVQSVESDPTKTDEYKALVRQKYLSALGMETLKSFDEKGGKGKKGKGGAGDQQQQGPAGMIAGILKHVATGLVGGEMPKGAPDVNPHELIGQMEAEYQGNQNKYNISSVQQAVTAKVQAATQGVQDTEEFNRKIAPLIPEINRAFGNQAQQAIQTWQSGYQPAPPVGSAEWYEREYARSHPPGSGAPPQGAQSFSQMAAQAYPSAPSTAAEMQTLAGIGKTSAGGGTPPPGQTPSTPGQDAPPPPGLVDQQGLTRVDEFGRTVYTPELRVHGVDRRVGIALGRNNATDTGQGGAYPRYDQYGRLVSAPDSTIDVSGGFPELGTPPPGAKPQGIGFTGVTLTGDQRQAAERMKRVRPGEDWEIEREYARSHPPGSGAPPPQPPPSAGGATPIPNTPAAPPNVAALPNTGPVNPRDIVPDPNAPAQSPTGGAVPQRAFNEQEWRQIKGMKRASPAKRYEFGSTSNPTRFIGHWVEPPDSPAGYYYQNGTPVPVGPEKIREAPLSEPREERPEKNVTLTVGGKKIPGLQVAGVPPGERFQDLNGNKIDPSSITAINEREDPVARENEDLLLRSYAQDHNTTVDKLTDSQKVEALGIMTPKQKAREKLEDTFKADTTRAEAAWISRRDEAGKLAVVQELTQDQIGQINKVIDDNYRAQVDWQNQMFENRKRLLNGATPSPIAASTSRKVSVANNNPGNIMHKVGDSYEFNQYATPQEGWDALRADLRTKINGQNAYGLKATSTLLDLAKVYAPEEAGNVPENWAKNIATYLKVPVDTPIGTYMTAERMEDLAKAVWFAEGSGGTYMPATGQSSGNGTPPPSGPQTFGKEAFVGAR